MKSDLEYIAALRQRIGQEIPILPAKHLDYLENSNYDDPFEGLNGCILDTQNNVVAACLSQYHLKQVPTEVTYLHNLLFLSLYDNKITKIEGFEKLQNLQVLRLDGNKITKIEGLEKLQNLHELGLNGNKIMRIEGLERLQDLRVLGLTGNKITKIEGLERLQELQELWMSYNQITKIEGLEKLQSLRVLGLSNNKITKIQGLGRLNGLEMLELSCNNIAQIQGLDKLQDLQVLALSDNRIKNIKGLECLQTLRKLQLSRNHIENIPHYIIDSGDARIIREHIERIAKEGAECLSQGEMRVLEHGRVGKPSFIKSLMHRYTHEPKKYQHNQNGGITIGGDAANAGNKKWYEKPMGVVTLGVIVTIIGGAILHYFKI